MSITYSFRRFLGIILLYSVFSLALLAPISGNEAIPSQAWDFIPHTIKIIQAVAALQEGQFPIRVEPLAHNGLGYPSFQFYSPFVFTIAGYIHKFFSPSNPFVALKMTLWLSIILGGFYIYRLAKEVNKQEISALLAGIAYMAAPYLLINVNARGDFTEVVGQGILPVVLYYTYKTYFSENYAIKNLFITGLTWALLAMTHLVTFVNASIVMSSFFIFLKKNNHLKSLFWIGSAYLYGFLLAFWFLVPVMQYAAILNIGGQLFNPIASAYLTPLPRLLAITSTSLMWFPKGTLAEQMFSPAFYPGIGLIMLLAAGISFYRLYIGDNIFKNSDGLKNIEQALLWIFLLTLFLTWSPIDFWKFLPHVLVITQFSYRFLAQLMWAGALLVSLAVTTLIKPGYSKQALCLGVIIILLSSSSWLLTYHTTSFSIEAIKKYATGGLAQTDYLLKESFISNVKFSNSQKSTRLKKNSDSDFFSVLPTFKFKEVQKSCVKIGKKLSCRLSVSSPSLFEFPFLYYPDLLKVMVDGQKKVDYLPSKNENYWLVKLPLSAGTHVVSITFAGLIWANWVSGLAWLALAVVFSVSLIRKTYLNLSRAEKFNLA
ncbi:MAG: hypothetical protein REH83_05660 [Rickettsiella sp.]|nr:hypothetical protein [Rickettsiella sp.]